MAEAPKAEANWGDGLWHGPVHPFVPREEDGRCAVCQLPESAYSHVQATEEKP